MAQRIVDLTLTLTDGKRGVGMTPHSTIAQTGYNTTDLRLYSHAGTHMDAPRHFLHDGGTIDHVPLDACMGPAWVIDLSFKTPNSLVTVEDLTPHSPKVTPGSRLLLRTDWSLHADQNDYRTHMPRLSLELARWLAARQVTLVGVETPSVASLRPENRAELIEVHQTLLRAGIVIVESLTALRDLRRDCVHFIALPLKLDRCDGSPVRAVAIEDDDRRRTTDDR